jgi:hypothetical protein
MIHTLSPVAFPRSTPSGAKPLILGRFLLGALLAGALVATVLQVFIDASVENVASASIVLASSLSILLYMLWSRALETHPLSVFVIFGFCLTGQLGALLAQTVYWTPLTYALYDPLTTFGTLALYQAIALAVHALYCYFSAPPTLKDSLVRGVLRSCGIYRTPAAGTLWIMGAIGLLGSYIGGGHSVVNKFGDILRFLVWAPFLIPWYRHRGGDTYPIPKHTWTLLGLYAAVIFIIAFATNGRAVLFKGVLTVALLYFLQALRSNEPVRPRAFLRLGFLALVAALALQPLDLVVAAMGSVRAVRGKVPPTEMIEKTLDALRNPRELRASAETERDKPRYLTAYDEVYLENSMVGRFVETKYHDNAIHFGRAIVSDESRSRLREATIDSFVAALPRQLLSALGITLNKDDIRYSMGDYLFYLVKGGGLGSYKTGSVFGQGPALFGPLFPIVYAVVCLAIFHWLRLLTFSNSAAVSVAAVAMINIWPFFQYGITAESLDGLVGMIIRGIPQMIFVYCLALGVARCLLGDRYVQKEPA